VLKELVSLVNNVVGWKCAVDVSFHLVMSLSKTSLRNAISVSNGILA